MLAYLTKQLPQKLTFLPLHDRTPNGTTVRYTRLSNGSPQLGHRRQLSLSNFGGKRIFYTAAATSLIVILCVAALLHFEGTGVVQSQNKISLDDGGPIPFGASVDRDGREVFWWEQFSPLKGYYSGRRNIVPIEDYIPEQQQAAYPFGPAPSETARLLPVSREQSVTIRCALDPPVISAYQGVPQGLPSQLLGSATEIGINDRVCYDRVNRYGPYGLGFPEDQGGVGNVLNGDNDGLDQIKLFDYRLAKWDKVLKRCAKKNEDHLAKRPKTAFIVRTWHDYQYTPHEIVYLRALVNELSLQSGAEIVVHFLIHVRDDTIPIWASADVYGETLRSALPPEFEGMGTLWSAAQMKLVYPGPFPESIENFSGGPLITAYRSLHLPLQYFASVHSEFDYFWQWEMDIRVTGHYGELIDAVTTWADRQTKSQAWERSSKFFVPGLFSTYNNFSSSIESELSESGQQPVSGPQIPTERLFPLPEQPKNTLYLDITDLITFNPLFDPEHTSWAFHNDITGYAQSSRPPTRASLITASRMSRRLLLLMHEETYRNQHTMFPEMYPASIALHYGLKAIYVPLPIYFDRDWPAAHANEVFNNAKVSEESTKAGMDHGHGRFHGVNGSVFGPAEHVFRGASYYSNAGFAEYLWRRWLGTQEGDKFAEWELGEGNGRMCLPMMVLHPIKSDV